MHPSWKRQLPCNTCSWGSAVLMETWLGERRWALLDFKGVSSPAQITKDWCY